MASRPTDSLEMANFGGLGMLACVEAVMHLNMAG